MSAAVERWPSWASPLVATAGVLALWESSLAIFNPDGFVLPAPSSIAAALFENWSELSTALVATGWIVVSGLVIGVLLGAAIALVVTRFRLANEALTPLAVAINAIPIIALAPLFNNWYGLTSPRSNQAIVVVLVFFPVFINTARGLTQVDSSQIELMESYAASKWTILKEVQIPGALPLFFTALRLASSLAVIAAIVAEYFGGRQDALGPMITASAGLARYAQAWAAVVLGSALGAVLLAVAVLLERLATPWRAHVTQSST